MNHEQAFLQAICEAPEDDTPRLVYADWLEENGQAERAQFIRVQCELARLPPDDPACPALREREKKLLRGNRQRWQAGKPTWASPGDFHRGFHVPRLKEGAERFLRRRPENFFPFPLWCFTITGAIDHSLRLASSPLLRQAAELNLTACAIGATGAEALANSPHLGNIVILGLRRNWMGSRGVHALAENLRAPRLRVLDLGGNRLNDEAAAAALAKAPFMDSVTELDLVFNFIQDAGGVALAHSTRLRRLEVLRLGSNYVGDKTARAIAVTDRLPRLRRLMLDNQMTNVGARALAAAAWLQQLECLYLEGCWRITAAGAHALRKAFGKRVAVRERRA
jgi:uncharacterized protein (TIGR02996 family)